MSNGNAVLRAALGYERYWPRRYTVIALFALSTVICYVDRVNIAIAVIPLARDRGYDEIERGLILSAFFWGYLWPQLPAGWLADRFGGKRVLGAGVALWSAATFLTPVCSVNLGWLLAARAVLGIGEAFNFPAIHSIAARWAPPAERARAISLHISGTALGTIIAMLASPPLIIAFGWPAVFYVSGALGFLWLIAWQLKSADSPEECPGVSEHELSVIRSASTVEGAAAAPPWKQILKEPAVWAIVMAHLCNNFGFYVLLLWLPSYLEHTFGVPLSRLGLLAMVPYITAFLVSNVSGWIADSLHRRGVALTVVRKLVQSGAFAIGIAGLLAMPHASSALEAVAMATLSVAGTALGSAGFAVNHLDVSPRYAGVLMGISNTFATLPGIVGVALAGFIVQATGSFSAVFYLAAGVYLAGMAAFLLWGTGECRI